MAKAIDEKIESINVPWESYAGSRVEEFIKEQLKAKYGYFNMRFNEGESMYYIECFNTQEDYLLYESGKDLEENPYEGLLLQNVRIPISTVQDDVYAAFLRSSENVNTDYVVTGDDLIIKLNYRAVKLSKFGNENAGYDGTLIIEKSTDGGLSWLEAGVIPNALRSMNYDDETEEDINIGPYLSNGRQTIRLRATYTYVDTGGITKTAVSANVNIGKTVTKTTLKIELARNFEVPIYAYDNTGKLNYFPFDYRLFGAVDKKLHIRITGAIGVNELEWNSSYTEDGQVIQKLIEENTAYGYFTHGVRKVEAWLTCDDGKGNTLTSNKLVNRFMIVNTTATEEVQLKPYLLLQNINNNDVAVNFVQKEFCQYAVYNPVKNEDGSITNTGGSIELAFLLTDYAEDYEVSGAKEHFRIGAIAEPGVQYSLLTTAEIEQEGVDEILEYATYFRVRKIDKVGGEEVSSNFMDASTNESYYRITVDNRGGFAPVTGATFLMNPKIRSNNEEDPAKIYNVKNNNAEVTSEFINFGFMKEKPTDGWMIAEDGERVLRILAGAKLKINYNPFKQFITAGNRASSMTMEIDFKVSNVTNETAPLIFIGEGTADNFKGVKMNALDGWIKTASYNSDDDCLFSWREGKRTHIAINLNYNVSPNLGDVQYPASTENPNGTIPLARVLVNGSPDREIPYTDAEGEWCTNENNQIIIGNEGADIDIYSIRIYENRALDMRDILIKNRIAALPTAAEKEAVRNNNDILTGNHIDVEAVKRLGKNCLIWHGNLPYYGNQSKQKGWYEVWRYDDKGNYLPEHSGTICKETKSLEIKGQGSTAKTYWDWNQQDNQADIEETIRVALADFHESISVRVEESEGLAYIKGGNLGKNFPVAEEEVAYPYSNGYVTVPDGWIDGNLKYRGMGYMVAPNTALAQKKVIKINYASSMQNHLVGACNTYNLLQKQINKTNSNMLSSGLQEDYPDAVCAKMTEPFMYFSQSADGQPIYFKGMGNYGAGKMDKVAWGYVKKLHPMFAMIEGADNNMPLCDFRVPFDHKAEPVYEEGECVGWSYAGNVSYDIDAALLDDNGDVDATVQQKWADIHNFVYLHSTSIKYYVGTFNDFKKSTQAINDTVSKYWCTQGGGYKLYRYDFVDAEWVPAGLWDSYTNSYKEVDLQTDVMTVAVYQAAVQAGTSAEYAAMNEAFIQAIAEHGKTFINYFIKADWLQYNYVYVLHFLAGTDNSSKNTYYVIDPKAKTMSVDEKLSEWFLNTFGREFDYNAIYQMELHGDDMDSILKTNNNAHQTKPYYIDRMHPYKDDDETTECLYEGSKNALFNFCEVAYEGDRTLQKMMKTVMIAMTDLVNESDFIAENMTSKKSLWGFLHKYFFNVQNYFPEMAYIEQNRIRYEFPHMIGFISSGAGARNVAPISQALGRQLDNELQYMDRRLIYMASYAAFGEFAVNENRAIGLDDVGETFSFKPAAMPDGSPADYIFDLTPHQYIYPTGFMGQTTIDPHVRAAAGKVTKFTLATGLTGSDTGLSITGINYYSNLGNFEDKSITSNLIINGKRLVHIAHRWVNSPFRPSSVEINASNIKTITFIPRSANLATVDCSRLIKATIIQVQSRNTIYPSSSNLSTISLIGTEQAIKMENIPNLKTLNVHGGMAALETLAIGQNVGTNVKGFTIQPLVEAIYNTQSTTSSPVLKSSHIENVNWTNFSAKALEWFIDTCTDECTFKGTISIAEPDEYRPAITWDLKNKINATFGCVDSKSYGLYNGLILNYKKRDFDIGSARIVGSFYPESGNQFTLRLRPSNIFENTQIIHTYNIIKHPQTTKLRINMYTGLVTVTALSDSYDEATFASYITTSPSGYSTNSGWKDEQITKTIEIWNRPAQVGDYVYADGTYMDPQYDDDEKTVIGVCIYTPPKNADGSINETFFNKNDKQQRLMVATRDVIVETSDTIYSSLPWGAFPIMPDNEETTLQRSLFYTDTETGEIKNLPNINNQSIYDIEAVANINLIGLDNAYTITEESFRDTVGEGLDNDGFKPFNASTAMGDGFAYNETADQRTARTLNSEIWNLTDKNTYDIGDIVNSGYAKTLKIIVNRNMILNNGIEIINLGSYPIPSASGSISELQSLGSLMDALKTWATDTHQDAYPNKWRQLAYPAASACYAYQPTDHLTLKTGEVLIDKFKSHNWFLPTQGILARMYWHSYGGNNIFADIPSSKFTQISNSNHWSSTEYNSHNSWRISFNNGDGGNNIGKHHGYVCRPIAAF